jgi:hypothetical protein
MQATIATFGFDMLIAIPSSLYFLTVNAVRKRLAYQRTWKRELRIQHIEEAKQLKW